MISFRRPGWSALAIALAAIFTVMPLWCVNSPAMPDYPAHLATYYLIATGAKAPAVAQFYRIEWAFIPNLAGEILVPLLSKLIALETAAKLFIATGIAMWVVGPALIHRALYGRIGTAPILAALFAYNANLMWGFLNYYFAIGLGFLVLAAWIAGGDNRSPLRLAGFALATTVIYFCHLFACATLAVMIGSYEIGAWIHQSAPAAARGMAPFWGRGDHIPSVGSGDAIPQAPRRGRGKRRLVQFPGYLAGPGYRRPAASS